MLLLLGMPGKEWGQKENNNLLTSKASPNQASPVKMIDGRTEIWFNINWF